MVFSDIAVGQEFCFGRIMEQSYTYRNGRRESTWVENPVIWKKTALNGLSVCVEERPLVSFDYCRTATGSSKSIRMHGHRLFFLSSLYKYLNCDDHSWRTSDNGDGTPYTRGNNECGFLSRFTQEEREYMTPFQLTVKCPTGYTRQYGESQTRNVLIAIPSEEQMGTRNNPGTFGINFTRSETWVHDADTMHHCHSGYSYRTGGDRAKFAMPVIKIKDDAPVDRDERGRYVIRVPETDFAGDLATFLGFDPAA